MNKETFKMKTLLMHPWTILGSMLLGGVFGAFLPRMATKLSMIGDVYLHLLQIAIIPIMMVSIITSFCNLFNSKQYSYYLKKIAKSIGLLMTITFVASFAAGTIYYTFSHQKEDTAKLINTDKASLANAEKVENAAISETNSDKNTLLEKFIPTNIIKSINNRDDIAIVIFSIVLGVCLGLLPSAKTHSALEFFDSIFEAFLKYVNALMYLLPIGIFFLISTFISKIGLSSLLSLLNLILSIWACFLVLFVCFAVIQAKRLKISFMDSIRPLKEAYFVAFGTSSSFAALPTAMIALCNSFQVSKQNVELILPLGISLFKPGRIMPTIIITLFLMSLYAVPINVSTLAILILSTLVFSIASTSGPAILSATMYSAVLSPLDIPPAIGIFLLLSIEPFIDPIATVLNVQSNCVLSVLVEEQKISSGV